MLQHWIPGNGVPAGALKLPMPPRPKHGRPEVTLSHLQLLLKRCRLHQREQLEVRLGCSPAMQNAARVLQWQSGGALVQQACWHGQQQQ